MKFKRGLLRNKINWWLALPIWICCAILGFTITNLYLNPSARVFLDSSYWSSLFQYEEALRLVHSQYVDRNKSGITRLSSFAVNGMLSGLDRHSRFFDPEEYKVFNDDTHRRYVGIGVMIRKSSNGALITRVFPGSPAEEEGLKIGDIIMVVNGDSVDEKDLDEVSDRIRGHAGTKVELEVKGLKGGIRMIQVIRNQIEVSSVESSTLDENGTAYLHLAQFTESSGEEVKELLSKYRNLGMKRIILDLRDNSGGLLTSAIQVVSLFLPTDTLIVRIQGIEKDEGRDFRSGTSGELLNFPIAILVNEGSASASEIVAGALSKNKRAILVGEKSFGKGSVQTIYPLRKGAGLKLTTAMYYFIDGSTIHETGIEPDYSVPCSEEDEIKLRIQRHAKGMKDYKEYQEILGFEEVEDLQLTTAYSLVCNLNHSEPDQNN